jgi:hypothetical protein
MVRRKMAVGIGTNRNCRMRPTVLRQPSWDTRLLLLAAIAALLSESTLLKGVERVVLPGTQRPR